MNIRFLLALLIGGFFSNISQSITAQNRENYSLLWEIEHKLDDKKSYVFGTFHAKDKRVFEFSDAVIPAIRNSEGFSLEIHPDSISDGLFDNILESGEENIYKRILSEEDYQRLNDRYMEINGEPLDSAYFKNPMLIESSLYKEISKKDDRRTFLDAYLLGIASSYGKKMHGLERIEDQVPNLEDIPETEIRQTILEILDSSQEEYNEFYEEMISIYYEGDIDDLFEFVKDKTNKDNTLDKRNRVMVNSLDSIMKQNSVFAAVGAAHLPGDQGIIELLRKKGYTVKKTPATFQNIQEDFELEVDDTHWYKEINEDLGFQVKVPSQPSPMEVREDIFAMMSPDLIFGGVFAYMAIDLRKQEIVDGFNFVENIINQQTNNNPENLISREEIVKNGHAFTDFLVNSDTGLTRMQAGIVNKIAYSFFVQHESENLNTDYVDLFFNSIRIEAPKVPEVKWRSYENKEGAFSSEVPGELNDLSRLVENPNGSEYPPYDLKIFASQDLSENMVYIFRYNNQPLGFYLQDAKELEDYLTEYFNTNGRVIGEPKPFKVGEYEGLEFELMLSEKYHTYARAFFRGNRTYMLLAQKSIVDAKSDVNNRFFNSFKLNPFLPAKLDSVVLVDNRYEFKMGSNMSSETNSLYGTVPGYDSVTNYQSTDLNSGGVFIIEKTTLKPFHRYDSLDDLYDKYTTKYIVEDQDSIIKSFDIVISGLKARELIVSNKLTKVKQRIQIVNDNENLIMLLAYDSDEAFKNSHTDSFFESFKVLDKKKRFDPFKEKSKMILKSLKSKDSTLFAQGKDALSYYPFEKKDLSVLSKALYETYRDDDKSYFNTKTLLINTITKLGGENAFENLKKYYLDKRTSNERRIEILPKLLEFNTSSSLSTYFEFIENHKPERTGKYNYQIFDAIADSLSIIEDQEERFITYIADDDFRDGLAAIYSKQIRDDDIRAYNTKKFAAKIITYAHEDARNFVDTIARNNKNHLHHDLINDYISIIKSAKISGIEAQNFLETLYLGLEKREWIKTLALKAAIDLNLNIEPQIIDLALEDYFSRFEVMEELIGADKLDVIPSEYFEAKEFTKLSSYNSLVSSNEEYPNQLEILGTAVHFDKTYAILKFEFSGEEKAIDYLAVSELKPANTDQFSQNLTYTNWDELQEDWMAQAKELLNERVKETN